jgi:mRNA-degrading endonuclease RelE of RelBE toxin-antitoxin system
VSYRLDFLDDAGREFGALPWDIQRELTGRLDVVIAAPRSHSNGCSAAESDRLWICYVQEGRFRVNFEVDEETQAILVFQVKAVRRIIISRWRVT